MGLREWCFRCTPASLGAEPWQVGLAGGFGYAGMLLMALPMGAGMGLQGLLSTARFAELLREHGSRRIVGLGAIAPPAGGVIGGVLGGLLSQRLGIQAGFLLMAIAFGLAAWHVARRSSGW